jgi:acyl phosphate:glycerol-3-phosphate acyltransferase
MSGIFLLKLLAAYLLGALSGSLVVGKLRGGVDIRTAGSGNAGATNALRTQGWKFALGVLLIDVGKGVVAALLIADWRADADPAWLGSAAPLACGLAAAIGHCWPVWHGFRGGKGAGTLFGAYVVLYPWAALVALGGFVLCLLSTGFVGLSTLCAGATLCAAMVLLGAPLVATGLTMAALALLLWTHRGNVARLQAGTEPRFEKARLLKW